MNDYFGFSIILAKEIITVFIAFPNKVMLLIELETNKLSFC